MPKNIVFCADGTWNSPGEVWKGKPAATNVSKLFNALPASPTQVTFYDDGVGVGGSLISNLAGAAVGDGLFKKVKDGYSDIAKIYGEGDNIHLFGFSRGAYTARSLAGMIARCGVPAPGKWTPDATEAAFQAYRERDPGLKAQMLEDFRLRYDAHDANVAQVGVWDTVGALGVPGGLFQGLNEKLYGFLDTTLNPKVGAGWQALAIDEHRSEFAPTLWTPPFAPGQKVDQVWFSGVHSDVGGGYSEPCLSDITLGWMMKKAASQGLAFAPDQYRTYTELPAARALDPMNHSWNPLWGLEPKERAIAPGSTIANTVLMRMKADSGYRPSNLQGQGAGIPKTMKVETVIDEPQQAMARS